eukprot:scaffold42617_cov19-Tisochrysis_lutea.AAC.2
MCTHPGGASKASPHSSGGSFLNKLGSLRHPGPSVNRSPDWCGCLLDALCTELALHISPTCAPIASLPQYISAHPPFQAHSSCALSSMHAHHAHHAQSSRWDVQDGCLRLRTVPLSRPILRAMLDNQWAGQPFHCARLAWSIS